MTKAKKIRKKYKRLDGASLEKEAKKIRGKYDWLDRAELEDFVREFLRRNADFQKDSGRIIQKEDLTDEERIALFETYRALVVWGTTPFLKLSLKRVKQRLEKNELGKPMLPADFWPPVAGFWTFPKG